MHDTQITFEEKQTALEQLCLAEAAASAKGWLPAGGGSLSIRLGTYAPGRFAFAVSASADGIRRSKEDYLFLNADGLPCEKTFKRPSIHAPIHAKIYRMTGCGAILHGHSVLGHWLSDRYADSGKLPLPDCSLRAMLDSWNHAASAIPIVPAGPKLTNTDKAAAAISSLLRPDLPCILLQNHGLYIWGSSPARLIDDMEIIEFLFQLQYHTLLAERPSI